MDCYKKFLEGNDYINEVMNEFIIGIPPLPNSWFVYVISFLYLSFYFSFSFEKKALGYLILVTFMILIIGLPYYWDWGVEWYSNTIPFLFGVIFGERDKNISNIINMNRKIILAVLLILCIVYILLCIKKINCPIHYSWVVPLILYGIICYFPNNLRNCFLEKIGKISYELYLVHGVFVLIFLRFVNNYFLYTVFCLFSSIICAIILHYIFINILKKLDRKDVKSNIK